jgi:WD40 repeat protein
MTSASTSMKAPRALIALVCVAWLGFLVFQLLRGAMQEISVDKIHVLDGKAKDLWITTDNVLIAVFDGNSALEIKKWKAGAIRSDQKPLAQLSIGWASLQTGSTGAIAKRVFAFSPSGDLFVWANSGKLHIVPLDIENGRWEESDNLVLRTTDISAIKFLDDRLVALVYHDGLIEIWDLAGKKKGRAGTKLDKAWLTWSYPPTLAAAYFRTGDVGVFRFSGSDHVDIQYYHSSTADGMSLVISDSGRILVGTASGRIMEMVKDAEGIPLGYIETSGKGISDLAFLDEDTVLIAGSPQGIYAKIGQKDPEKVSRCPPAEKLRIRSEYLAYTTSNSTEIAEIKKRSRILRDVPYMVSTVLAILGIIVSLWPLVVPAKKP